MAVDLKNWLNGLPYHTLYLQSRISETINHVMDYDREKTLENLRKMLALVNTLRQSAELPGPKRVVPFTYDNGTEPGHVLLNLRDSLQELSQTTSRLATLPLSYRVAEIRDQQDGTLLSDELPKMLNHVEALVYGFAQQLGIDPADLRAEQ